MKVCFIGWADHVHMERWASYFAVNGYSVSVISVSGKGAYPHGVRQYSLGSVPYSYRAKLCYLKYLLRKIAPDIVHVHWASFASLLDNVWQGPLVITAWGSDIYRVAEGDVKDRQKIVTGLEKADLITCDSRDQVRAILELSGVEEQKIHLIQWGVDTEKFTLSTKSNPIMANYALERRKVLISPRAFTPLYNLLTIVRAFKHLQSEEPNAVMLMKKYTGEHNYIDRVKSEIKELGLDGSVYILERVSYEEMPWFYQAGDVMISIPDSDGTPMSLLEGMSCGCFPVASNLASVREWIEDGNNGYLVPPDIEPRELARVLLEALVKSSEGKAIRKFNNQIILDTASQKANMERMAGLYNSLLKGRAI